MPRGKKRKRDKKDDPLDQPFKKSKNWESGPSRMNTSDKICNVLLWHCPFKGVSVVIEAYKPLKIKAARAYIRKVVDAIQRETEVEFPAPYRRVDWAMMLWVHHTKRHRCKDSPSKDKPEWFDYRPVYMSFTEDHRRNDFLQEGWFTATTYLRAAKRLFQTSPVEITSMKSLTMRDKRKAAKLELSYWVLNKLRSITQAFLQYPQSRWQALCKKRRTQRRSYRQVKKQRKF